MASDTDGNDRLKAAFRGMSRLPSMRQLGLLIGLALSIALGVYIALWSHTLHYDVAYKAHEQASRHTIESHLLSRDSHNQGAAAGFAAPGAALLGVINTESSPPKEQSWLRSLGNQLPGILLAMLVLFTVLRPVMHNLSRVPGTAQQHEAARGEADPEDALTGLRGGRARHLLCPNDYASELEMVRAFATQDPKRVAQLVRQWVNET